MFRSKARPVLWKLHYTVKWRSGMYAGSCGEGEDCMARFKNRLLVKFWHLIFLLSLFVPLLYTYCVPVLHFLSTLLSSPFRLESIHWLSHAALQVKSYWWWKDGWVASVASFPLLSWFFVVVHLSSPPLFPITSFLSFCSWASVPRAPSSPCNQSETSRHKC